MDTQQTEQSGQCACGDVRYTLLKKPMFVHCCHCTWCQRESGASFAVNAMIEADQMRVEKGKAEAVSMPTHSKKGQTIWRCPTCKTALWSHYASAGNMLNFVKVGTLDAPNQCPPDMHIYTSTKQKWLSLPPGIPVVSEYYNYKEHWPQDSQNRLNALFQK